MKCSSNENATFFEQCVIASVTVVHCGNVNVIYMIADPVHFHPTKRIKINIHFVLPQESCPSVVVLFQKNSQLWLLRVPLSHQFADITNDQRIAYTVVYRVCASMTPNLTPGGY